MGGVGGGGDGGGGLNDALLSGDVCCDAAFIGDAASEASVTSVNTPTHKHTS